LNFEAVCVKQAKVMLVLMTLSFCMSDVCDLYVLQTSVTAWRHWLIKSWRRLTGAPSHSLISLVGFVQQHSLSRILLNVYETCVYLTLFSNIFQYFSIFVKSFTCKQKYLAFIISVLMKTENFIMSRAHTSYPCHVHETVTMN